MKRIFSILLALTLMLALAVPAFATEIPPKSGESSKDVTANYATSDDDVTHTYYVTIAWDAPEFTYNFQGTMYTWDTTHLKYTADSQTGEAGWLQDDSTYADSVTKDIKLTVTNRSDMPVYCSANKQNSGDWEGVTVTYNSGAAKTGTAESVVAQTVHDNKTWSTFGTASEAKTLVLTAPLEVSGAPAVSGKTGSVTLTKITVTLDTVAPTP